MFNCVPSSMPPNQAFCQPNNDPIFNYKCTGDGNFGCYPSPSLRAIYTDSVE